MLPAHLRNRRSGGQHSGSMNPVQIVLRDTTTRLRRLPLKCKCVLVLSLLLSIFVYHQIFSHLIGNRLTKESYLEMDKCPACYGTSMCRTLLDGQIRLSGWSRFQLFDFVNLKNVHIGEHSEKELTVVLKKLGHDIELQKLDEKICKEANRDPGCDVARVLHRTSIANEISRTSLLPRHLQERTSMFICPSHRLLERLFDNYKEKLKPDQILFGDKLQILATSMVSTESLLLQTFPASDGWPFPEYYGACGRFIVVEYGGKPLHQYFDATWSVRADLAYQIMQIADQLTNGKEDFTLYWTDLNWENFGVDASGRLMVIDVEHILVVDRRAIEAVKPDGWDEFHQNEFEECESESCLSFNPEDLCNHVHSDLNYYAACRNVLSKYSSEGSMAGGLLHDMPDYAKDDWDLENLLNECVKPRTPEGRITAKDKILDALDKLRNTMERPAGERLP